MSGNVTIYKRKRIKGGLSKADMARELGIDYKRYNLIERGDVKMPSRLIDKFNEIINRGNENKLTSLEHGAEADKFWEEMCKRDDKDIPTLYKKMNEFNIGSVKDLATLLGYKSPGMIYQYLKTTDVVNDDFKKRVYLFFTNELNIQEPIEKQTVVHSRSSKQDEEMTEYYNETNFKELMKRFNVTSKQICEELGINKSGFSRMINKIQRMSDKKMLMIRNYFDKLASENNIDFNELVKVSLTKDDKEPIEVSPDSFKNVFPKITVVTEKKPSVLEKYEEELKTIDNEIEGHKKAIEKLMSRKDICFEIMSVIEEIENKE